MSREEALEHFGIKGMHWGIRKDQDPSNFRLQGADLTVDSRLPSSTKAAGREVASLIGERYGFRITSLNAIAPGHEEYERGTIGYVQSTPGKMGGSIYVHQSDVRKSLKDAEEMDWFAKDCGTVRAFLTHESAHALFHADQQVKSGLLGPKVVGGNIKARDKALKAAMKEVKREGIPPHLFSSKVSGYAKADGSREELEAELFSQYHWSSNPPQFVKVWGETLHQELGIDSTPFREVVTHV